MFHVDSDGDESMGKAPCHQAFLVGWAKAPIGVKRQCVLLQVISR